MLPKLVFNLGVAALAAAVAAYVVRGSGYEMHEYSITLTKGANGYSVSQKTGFQLSYHGATHWEIHNDTDDEVEFKVNNFKPQGANGCPVDFVGNTGNTGTCSGFATMAPRKAGQPAVIYSDVIKVKRHRSDAGKYTFDMAVNGTTIDPDIEIERDPEGLIISILSIGGLLTLLLGWWLGRQSSGK